FESSFTNTPGVVTQTGSIITINGGGGNVDLTKRVPEPVTLSIFGAGLAGAAALRRRKVKKA
ncbi:MAG TPA: PEP-CTERM sorting domain-containing protein, partial [Rhizomicrobium sp.]|nr:PEP-CTERM sorting domain-containing protein [Rhizomicrobium sp.]